MSDATDALLGALKTFGLAYPGAHSKAPWPEHDDLAVNDKTFAYLPVEGQRFSLSVKLPYTGEVALGLPFAKPTAYGLGKSGWVTSRLRRARFRAWSSSRTGSTRATGRRRRRSW